jgi:site-specific DNA-methyltransferase (adenine-specific)
VSIAWNRVNSIDCIDGLSQIESDSVDCLIVDPPYNIGKDFGNNKTRKEMQDYISWCKEWLRECERILSPSGTMYIYGFSEILAFISIELTLPSRWLIWHYTNKTVPSLNFWQRSHESILCVWKSKESRIFNRDEVREPYTENFVKGYSGGKRKRPPGVGRFNTKGKDIETTYTVNKKGALPRDVIKVPSLAGGSGVSERYVYSPSLKKLFTNKQAKNEDLPDGIKHPTQKPTRLTQKLLDACIGVQNKNSKVVIPFGGTGSEGFVCQQKQLKWIAFEINEDYVTMSNLLIKNGFPTNKEKQ